MQSRSTALSVGEGWVALSIHPEEYPPRKDYERIAYKSILYYVPVLSSYVCDPAALPRMSANADFSIPLKCLASGKKSIQQLTPSTPWQTSALELSVFAYFLCIPVRYTMEC